MNSKKGSLLKVVLFIVLILFVGYIGYHYDEYKLKYTTVTKDNYLQILEDISTSALSDLEKSAAVKSITENIGNFEIVEGKTVNDLIKQGKDLLNKN